MIRELSEILGYEFNNLDLLQQAVTRKSAFLEEKVVKKIGHNENLEFFGDSILRAVIDKILIELFPKDNEDQLSKKRDDLVSKTSWLSKSAKKLQLGKFIMMGKGERKNFAGPGEQKILSDVMEAVIGAIFIDSDHDFKLLKRFIIKHWNFSGQYNDRLIDSIMTENVEQVRYWLNAGADPNATGAITIYKYHGEWGKGAVTLFAGGYEGGRALDLAILGKRKKERYSGCREARAGKRGLY